MSTLDLIRQHGLEAELNGEYVDVYPASRLTDELRQYIRDHKRELVQELTGTMNERLRQTLVDACHGLQINPDELMAYLSDDDLKDWANGDLTPAQLHIYAGAVVERITRDASRIPENYTAVTRCKGCGPVWIFEGCPSEVWGCPWCWNRARGRPIPRPNTNHTQNEDNEKCHISIVEP